MEVAFGVGRVLAGERGVLFFPVGHFLGVRGGHKAPLSLVKGESFPRSVIFRMLIASSLLGTCGSGSRGGLAVPIAGAYNEFILRRGVPRTTLRARNGWARSVRCPGEQVMGVTVCLPLFGAA